MKTAVVIEDIVEMVRLAHGGQGDPLMFELRLPNRLTTAQAYLTTAVAIIDALTSGPNQDAVLAGITKLGSEITTDTPQRPGEDDR
ncbi:hypothetical protein [Arthrobacter sp. B3I4]|uniref:hypothetical protein n=1 Tax=Arthrobacter sp. B3I4 TaxID=3042267 RepID=UPI002788968E|nr:hypothetical protein [Arthrobacter sp. B3I4]MDQ0755772.1 putative ArsR family transcriptional regulator [Arthrobacter sp. B3I4]